MDKGKILYYRNDVSASVVRVLLFNDAINVYDDLTNNFLVAYPLKGATITKTGDDFFIYPGLSKEYLLIPEICITPELSADAAMEIAGNDSPLKV